MSILDDNSKAIYFKRVYEAIDGLWFMALESDRDFEYALDIDQKVWRIVPKIQARKLKELMRLENGVEALAAALAAKAELDGADVEINAKNDKLSVKIKNCPWHELMKKSGREHLAGRVGRAICGVEYPVWMKEFGVTGEFKIEKLLCDGDDCCFMVYHNHNNGGVK
jgi:hypothetical protein